MRTHLSQCELLELLRPDSCWASSSIFSMSPLYMETEAGAPLPFPLLLKCSSTHEPAGTGQMSFPQAAPTNSPPLPSQGAAGVAPQAPAKHGPHLAPALQGLAWPLPAQAHGHEGPTGHVLFCTELSEQTGCQKGLKRFSVLKVSTLLPSWSHTAT